MKKGVLSEFRFERLGISVVLRVDIQHVSPCGHDPLGRYGDESEDKSLYATRLLEPERLGVKPAHNGLVEIAYQCGKQKENCILVHERLWEPAPSKSVVHVVKDALLATTKVVEFNNVSCR